MVHAAVSVAVLLVAVAVPDDRPLPPVASAQPDPALSRAAVQLDATGPPLSSGTLTVSV